VAQKKISNEKKSLLRLVSAILLSVSVFLSSLQSSYSTSDSNLYVYEWNYPILVNHKEYHGHEVKNAKNIPNVISLKPIDSNYSVKRISTVLSVTGIVNDESSTIADSNSSERGNISGTAINNTSANDTTISSANVTNGIVVTLQNKSKIAEEKSSKKEKEKEITEERSHSEDIKKEQADTPLILQDRDTKSIPESETKDEQVDDFQVNSAPIGPKGCPPEYHKDPIESVCLKDQVSEKNVEEKPSISTQIPEPLVPTDNYSLETTRLCEANKSFCSNMCVDTKTDSRNCGACGKICENNQICTNAKCVGGQQLGERYTEPCTCRKSDGTCFDPAVVPDDNNCGECGTVCEQGKKCLPVKTGLSERLLKPAHTNQCLPNKCDATLCVGGTYRTCSYGIEIGKEGPSASLSCEDKLNIETECVNLLGNANHCGACGVKCPYASHPAGNRIIHSVRVCDNGKCNWNCGGSESGYIKCDGKCEPKTKFQEDNNNCGACGKVCTLGRICEQGQCQCQSGERFDPILGCVDSRTGCKLNMNLCGGKCVNSFTDKNNCGRCNNKCEINEICDSGTCNCLGQRCGAKCVLSFGSDPNNCGSCGNVCEGEKVCNAGNCQCPSGKALNTVTQSCDTLCSKTCGGSLDCRDPGTVCVHGVIGRNTYNYCVPYDSLQGPAPRYECPDGTRQQYAYDSSTGMLSKRVCVNPDKIASCP
jgi:hypothetical protein